MCSHRPLTIVLGCLAAMAGPILWSCWAAQGAGPPEAAAAAVSLDPPNWRVGDKWVVETRTEPIQGGAALLAAKPLPVRWQFRVVSQEKVAGRECFRVEVECMAQGPVRPNSTLWCDKSSLFLRQFQTQVAFNGTYRTIQESYECSKSLSSPVLTMINALPLALPAFLPKGAKADGSFTYLSQPLPAGVKDLGVVKFAHTVKQAVLPPGSKSLEKLPQEVAKTKAERPVVEVQLADGRQSIVQLWQQGAPWPVYVNMGRTQAWLVNAEQQ